MGDEKKTSPTGQDQGEITSPQVTESEDRRAADAPIKASDGSLSEEGPATDAPIKASDGSVSEKRPTADAPIKASDGSTNGGVTPIPDAGSIENSIENMKLKLERYKAQLDFWKFVLGSVVAAIVIAIIPPLFQYATAYLETTRKATEREKDDQKFRNDYVKDFLNKALDEDIEKRIRLAQYFSKVTTDTFKAGWEEYLDFLTSRRDKIFKAIDDVQEDIYIKSQDRNKYSKEIETLNRKLQRMNHEIGAGAAPPSDRETTSKPD